VNKNLFKFDKTKPDGDFIDEIFTYDVRKLESTDDIVISKYAIALAQYLVFYKAEVNRLKVEILRKQRFIDGTVNQLLTNEIQKRYKAKKDAYHFIVNSNEDLFKIQQEIFTLEDELMLIEGIDRTISELIATFKRELTRRDNELYTVRREKYEK
jgi:hypothetical protein